MVGSGLYPAIVKAPTVTGPLSALSSSYLLYRIVSNLPTRRQQQQQQPSEQQSKKPRDLLLLGLCFFDICGSAALSFSTYPGPAFPHLQGGYITVGTIPTCTAQGFFVQLGLAVPLYNAALCIYYVLAVQFKVRTQLLSRYMVPLAHGVIITFIFSTAFYALATDLFNFAGAMGCWIGEVKDYDDYTGWEDLEGRGKNAEKFEWYFGGLHLAISFVVVVLSMIILVESTTASRTLPLA